MYTYIKIPIYSKADWDFIHKYAYDNGIPVCKVFYHMTDFYKKKKEYDVQKTVDDLEFKKVMGIEL